MCFCHPSFRGVLFDGPSQAMEALQPTHALMITPTAANAHIRQTGSGLGISAVCVPSSAVFSHSFSLSLCFDVACVCQQRACTIISAGGAGHPLSLPTVKSRGHCFSLLVVACIHAQFRRALSDFFLAKWILKAKYLG